MLTYLSAVVLHLFFEAPYLKIFRAVFLDKIGPTGAVVVDAKKGNKDDKGNKADKKK